MYPADKNINVDFVEHKGQKRIKLVFDYDAGLIRKVKSIPGRAWSQTMGCWHVPHNKQSIKKLLELELLDTTKTKGPKQLTAPARNSLIDFRKYLKLKRLSDKTIVSYTEAIKKMLLYYPGKQVSEITHKDINEYMYNLTISGVSSSMQNITVSAIKLFYQKIENRQIDIKKLERPKKSNPLPKVIARKDVEKLLSSTANLKHKAALTLIYSLGLRRSELLNLKLTDIDSKRMVVNIINSKGKKDRIIPLSEKLLILLKKYYQAYKPKLYLIEGTKSGGPYSETSLREVFKKNMEQIVPGNRFTLHCLRHSFATHLLEQGTDIRFIQELLGHKSTRTTEIYTHVSVKSLRNIKNVIDDLDII